MALTKTSVTRFSLQYGDGGNITAYSDVEGSVIPATILFDPVSGSPTTGMQLIDNYGFNAECTPMGELRTIVPYRLAGSSFAGTTLDTAFWTSGSGTGGSIVVGNSKVRLSTGTTANNIVYLQTSNRGRYIAGCSNRFRGILQLPTDGLANHRKRWGAFTDTNGAFFELEGSTLKVGTRKTSLDSTISSGSFNGDYGSAYEIGTNAATYEIYWTNLYVYFVIGDVVLHKISALTDTWSDTLSFPARFEISNINDSIINDYIDIRAGSIYRLGNHDSQPLTYFTTGSAVSANLKNGPGKMRKLTVSNISNGAIITLYDNTAASGTIKFSTGAIYITNQSSNPPITIDLDGGTFDTGLTMTITGATASAYITYE